MILSFYPIAVLDNVLLLESDLVDAIRYIVNFLAHLRYPFKLKVSKPLVR